MGRTFDDKRGHKRISGDPACIRECEKECERLQGSPPPTNTRDQTDSLMQYADPRNMPILPDARLGDFEGLYSETFRVCAV